MLKDFRRYPLFLFLAGLIVAAQAGGARAEQLAIKTYTIADGLPRDGISRIVRDSRGFLWFCTPEGLSRYDGYEFVTFGANRGLTNVNDLLETRKGDYWIATSGGVARLSGPVLLSRTAEIKKAKCRRNGVVAFMYR